MERVAEDRPQSQRGLPGRGGSVAAELEVERLRSRAGVLGLWHGENKESHI